MEILLLFIFCLFSFLPPQERTPVPSQELLPDGTSISSQELLPDGTPMPAFLTDTFRVSLEGKRRYVLTRYGFCRDSGFWTNHLYKCDHVRYLGSTIVAPTEKVKAPSSDAIDIDYCHDVLVDRCYMSVNDDGVVLKGGKGTWADTMAVNGPNYNVLVQNCRFSDVVESPDYIIENLNYLRCPE